MNISEEKEHLYSMMRDITSERRKLTEMYFGLKERLDDLNSLEQKGLKDISIKGYVDYFNESQREIFERNIRRETEYTINNINKQFDSVNQTPNESVIPKQEVAESRFYDRQGKGFSNSGGYTEPIEKPMSELVKSEQVQDKDDNYKEEKKPKRERKAKFTRAPKVDDKKVSKIVENILKELEEPLSLGDLYELVISEGKINKDTLKKANFSNNVMPRVLNINPRIKKAHKGHYQYV